MKIHKFKTDRFNLTIGTTPGYHVNNPISQKEFNKLWMETANKVYQESGYYISCNTQHSDTLYHEAGGCPAGGEETFYVQGVRNAMFAKDSEAWKASVRMVVEYMAESLNQTTAYLAFQEVDFEYLVKE